jgi:hypothetical protein
MSIYWMRTKDVYPDGGYDDTFFTAFDPEVRFPRFHMVEGDETIGNVHLISSGPQAGQWQWSMTVSLPGHCYGSPTNGVEAKEMLLSLLWKRRASLHLTLRIKIG